MIKLNLELDANNWRHMKAAAMFFGQLVKQDEAAPYVEDETPEEYVERTDAEQAIEATQEAQKAKAQKAEAEALEAEKKAVKAARDKARREKIKAEKEVRNGGTEEADTEESEEADTEEDTDQDETKLTLNDVRSIVSEKAKLAGAREKIVAELKGYGVENTTKLDSKYYGAFVSFLKTLS